MTDHNQFKEIKTGNGYQNDLIATTNNRLEATIVALQSLERTFSSNLFLLQEDIRDLNETIKKANIKNDKLQKWFLTLTFIGTLFTATQLIQVADILIRGLGK